MSRRIRPPMHPVTGHPYVDNELRNDWRAHRDYMRCKPVDEATEIAIVISGSAIWHWRPIPLARKPRKRLLRSIYTTAFSYYPTVDYTPERMILNDPR